MIKGVYEGDSNFKTSKSAVLTQVVNTTAGAIVVVSPQAPVAQATTVLPNEASAGALVPNLLDEQGPSKKRNAIFGPLA